MPFTPLHLGPGLSLGMIFKRWVNLPSILLASIIVDVRAIYLALFVGDWSNLHGFFHTFVGAPVLGLLTIVLVWLLRRPLLKASAIIQIEQDYSLKSIITGSLIGVWMHILLDSYMHKDIQPFWPLYEGNPLYGGMSASFELLFICLFVFLIGFGSYLFKTIKKRNACA